MSRISNPIRFSDNFDIPEERLVELGVLNPTLNVDTRLFIDPLLLSVSAHVEIREGARTSYEKHFSTIIKLLHGSNTQDDAPWKAARRMLSFPEVKWTCLGYGGHSISGSGSGTEMTEQIIRTAKQIVDLGVDDPDLFVAMALFEEGFGPDRISDMSTNVVFGDLIAFNHRILKSLSVPCKQMQLVLRNGATFQAHLPLNPFVSEEAPIVLVPMDVLRHLPIVTDWSDVADAASKNDELRNRVNKQVADLWSRKSRKDKGELRRWAMSGKDAFSDFLDMIKGAGGKSYDFDSDPVGEIFWRKLAATLADNEPLILKVPPILDLEGVSQIVVQIIDQFRFLVEDRRYSEELYQPDGSPRPEKSAQRLFFAVAHTYCKANNLDITPEADTGNGPVDFKVSKGFNGRVLVEIKLSTNSKLVKGYTRQLETYKTAEETQKGFYLVVDVGQMGNKDKALLDAKNEASTRGEETSQIIFVNGIRKPSASKL